MRRPSKTFPTSPGFMASGTPKNLPDPQLDPIAFEQLIHQRGLRWKHYRATQCPNIKSLETGIHDPNCRQCENGQIFYGGAIVHGLNMQYKLEKLYESQGAWDLGNGVVTFSAYADDEDGNPGMGPAIDLQPFDKLICLDYSFRWSEVIEHSPTGIDRLRYPALTVEYVATKDKVYYIDEDFIINEVGYLKWTGQNQPLYDQLNSLGEIFTVAYTAQPVFYVIQLIYEIRATKAFDQTTGAITAVRLPQQVLIRRDYLFSHPGDKVALNTQPSPRSGGTVNTPD